MGSECRFWYVLLQGGGVSFAHTRRTNNILGAVAEILAKRLAERFCAVLRYSSAVVIILASISAE